MSEAYIHVLQRIEVYLKKKLVFFFHSENKCVKLSPIK